MNAPLLPDVADRLAKICGRFGSDHDGERAVAARMADQIVRNSGLSWSDVIAPPLVASKPRRHWRPLGDPFAIATQCLGWPEILSPWELDFLRSLGSRTRLSDKQRAALGRIAGKVSTFATVAGEA